MQPKPDQPLHPFIVATRCKNSQVGIYHRMTRDFQKRVNWISDICSFSKLILALKQHPHATILLCTRLNGYYGGQSLKQIKQQFPAATVILISEQYAALNAHLVKEGNANAYLLSETALPADYTVAFDACLAHEKFYPADVAQFMLHEDNQPINLNDGHVRAIFDYMLQSKSVGEISLLTKIHERTVRRICEKIKNAAAKYKYGFFEYAIEHRFINL